MEVQAPMPSPSRTRGRERRAQNATQPNTPAQQNSNETSNEEQQNTQHLVMARGYTPFTRIEDMIREFSKFGEMTILNKNQNHTLIAYLREEDARKAVDPANKLVIYGSPIKVRLLKKKDNNIKNNVRKNNTYSKRPKGDSEHAKNSPQDDYEEKAIISPSQIDLSGDFYAQLDNVMCNVRLTREQVEHLSLLYMDLEFVLQELWPGATVMPFGSVTTGLGIKTSDADCFVHLPEQFRGHSSGHVARTRRCIASYRETFAKVVSIPRAATPIVKFLHLPTNTYCDVSFKTPLGTRNSELIMFLLHYDPRLIPMSILIKYWARVHLLTGNGRMSNYALTMLVIFYLQQPHVRILPSIRTLQQNPKFHNFIDHWNAGFNSQYTSQGATTPIPHLIGGFFTFYKRFNFADMVVSPYLGYAIEKERFSSVESLPEELALYKENVLTHRANQLNNATAFCVQDPFEHSHNVASRVGMLAAEIIAFITFAADTYEASKDNNCDSFLREILLKQPFVNRSGKTKGKVKMSTFIIRHIQSEQRIPKIREVFYAIFESMLKLKLARKDPPSPSKESHIVEVYEITVERYVWKRKQFSRIYDKMNYGFIEKEAKITEEILRVDKNKTCFKFDVALEYVSSPLRMLASLKYMEGDYVNYLDFTKFFESTANSWVYKVLLAWNELPVNLKANKNRFLSKVTADEAAALNTKEIAPMSFYNTNEMIERGFKLLDELGKNLKGPKQVNAKESVNNESNASFVHRSSYGNSSKVNLPNSKVATSSEISNSKVMGTSSESYKVSVNKDSKNDLKEIIEGTSNVKII